MRVFLVQVGLGWANVVSPNRFMSVLGFANGDAASIDALPLEFTHEEDEEPLPIGDFVGFGVNSWYGVASPEGRAFIDSHCVQVRWSPMHVVPAELRGHAAFSVDRVIHGGVDIPRSEILGDGSVWRKVNRVEFTQAVLREGLFRVAEQPFFLLCTEKVVSDYESAKLTGLKFIEVSPRNAAGPDWTTPR